MPRIEPRLPLTCGDSSSEGCSPITKIALWSVALGGIITGGAFGFHALQHRRHHPNTPTPPQPFGPGPGPALAPAPVAPPLPGYESWAWVYENYQTSLATIGANRDAFTHISPTFYSLNYDYTEGVAAYSNCNFTPGTLDCVDEGANDFDGMTTHQFTQAVSRLGLATVPAIYAGASNDGIDTGVLNILENTNNASSNFIGAMVQEALDNGYAGYNLDWEMGKAVNGSHANKFISFVNDFKSELEPHGMMLTLDAIVSNLDGTYCSGNNGYLDFSKLANTALDRIMIEDYSPSLGNVTNTCQSMVLSNSKPVSCPLNDDATDTTATGLLNIMCSNLPERMIVIGLESYSTASNGIAGSVMGAIKQYGLRKVAIWPQAEAGYPFLSANGLKASAGSWYTLLSQFLRGN